MRELRPAEEIGLLAHVPLHGRKLLLGVTGSSAIYKSVDLARRLIRMGAEVRVVMTRAATRLVGPDLFYWATGRRPYVEMTGETEHIDLAKWADAMVVAPATLNTMCKLANGVLDELLTLTAAAVLGDGKKVVVVPAMNIRLMNSPLYKKCVQVLTSYGAVVIPPLVEEDKAKYPPLEDLAHCIDAIVNRGRDLEGARVLVTAGATREHLDPVRVLTNPSSGLMGVLVAREAACRGSSVVLVHGAISVDPPYMVERLSVETTEDMARAVAEYTEREYFDAAVFAAAPADYRPREQSSTKYSTREHERLVVELEATPKVIKSVVKRPRVVVGFAAETAAGGELYSKALEKLRDYGLDLVVANNVLSKEAGFGKAFLEAVILTRSEEVVAQGLLTKHEVARIVVDYVAKKFREALA
ncbi:MAG: bifunctional phosphopantothenoylcysteine decarboxylase/phosphopantothenate--cysteine ligase CoaBC [Desulfurococcaceae archaeon]